jgi:hypothetical protein
MKLLKEIKDIENFRKAIEQCQGDVIIRHNERREEFNMKSLFSCYIGLGKLAEEHGDEYEVFCMNKKDEAYMMQFFHELNNKE